MKEKWLNDLQARIQKEYHVSAPEGLLDDIKSEMLRRGITRSIPASRNQELSHYGSTVRFLLQPWLSSDYTYLTLPPTLLSYLIKL